MGNNPPLEGPFLWVLVVIGITVALYAAGKAVWKELIDR